MLLFMVDQGKHPPEVHPHQIYPAEGPLFQFRQGQPLGEHRQPQAGRRRPQQSRIADALHPGFRGASRQAQSTLEQLPGAAAVFPHQQRLAQEFPQFHRLPLGKGVLRPAQGDQPILQKGITGKGRVIHLIFHQAQVQLPGLHRLLDPAGVIHQHLLPYTRPLGSQGLQVPGQQAGPDGKAAADPDLPRPVGVLHGPLHLLEGVG